MSTASALLLLPLSLSALAASPPPARKGAATESPAAVKDDALVVKLRSAVEEHIADNATRRGGMYALTDGYVSLRWMLEPQRVDTEGVRKLGPELYLVTGHFFLASDDDKPVPVTVAFTVRRFGGRWMVIEASLERVGKETPCLYTT